MERNIAIMIASIPAMRPLAALFTRFVNQTFDYSRKRSNGVSESYEMAHHGSRFKQIGQQEGSQLVSHDRVMMPRLIEKQSSRTLGQHSIQDLTDEQILPVRIEEYI